MQLCKRSENSSVGISRYVTTHPPQFLEAGAHLQKMLFRAHCPFKSRAKNGCLFPAINGNRRSSDISAPHGGWSGGEGVDGGRIDAERAIRYLSRRRRGKEKKKAGCKDGEAEGGCVYDLTSLASLETTEQPYVVHSLASHCTVSTRALFLVILQAVLQCC